MLTQFKGEVFALAAAITWAVALILFKRSGERVSPLALNIFKNAIALSLLGVTLIGQYCLVGVSLAITTSELLILALSGIIGMAIADTLFFHALNRVGVGIVSIVDCAYTPFVVLFSWLLIREQLTLAQAGGIALILTGVLLASRHTPPAHVTRRQLVGGILLGVLAMALMALGIVMAKRPLERLPVVSATTIRLLAGTLALLIYAAFAHEQPRVWTVFHPTRAWRTSVPGSILGAYVCLLFWIAGYKYAPAGVAAILNQTTVIFALILATLVLREPFGGRKAAAVALALAGVLVITLSRGAGG